LQRTLLPITDGCSRAACGAKRRAAHARWRRNALMSRRFFDARAALRARGAAARRHNGMALTAN